MRLILVLLVLGGCGWSETKFNVKGIEAYCEAASECEGGYDAATCIDAIRTVDRSSCDYDPKAANDCYKALDEAVCETNSDLYQERLIAPKACGMVWDGCGTLFPDPIETQ
ncbi:MAG: hypothetical protein GWP91_24890 [Rhodobacterales bacterium]|nr:hypothetical protein [Rhodobacterales bacterium]